MGLALITAPAIEPVTRDEAKLHSRIETYDDDQYVDSLIATARRRVEDFTNRALINQTWEVSMDTAPAQRILRLPKPPLYIVNSIKYYNEADVESLYGTANYRFDTTDSQGGRIVLKDGSGWPTGLRYTSSIVIRFVAGYGTTAALVPEPIRHAIKLLVAHWYENREPVNVGNIVNEIQLMVDHLLYPFKVFRL